MRFLSDDWLAHSIELTDDQPVAGAFSGSVDVEVGGGPDGKVVTSWGFEDGRLVSAVREPAAEPAVGLILKHDDARALVAGERDLNALFISGQMKVAGDTGPLLELLAATHSDAFRSHVARMEAATDD